MSVIKKLIKFFTPEQFDMWKNCDIPKCKYMCFIGRKFCFDHRLEYGEE